MRPAVPRAAVVVSIVAAAMVGVACSDEQKRDVEGVGVRVALADDTMSVLDVENVNLDGDLDCKADIDDDNVVTASCEGTDENGDAVVSTVEGTVDPDEATCDSVFRVTLAGEVLVEDADHDCLD
ncbi:MAG: hypothetical protein MUE78_06095 [Ilumatobacteraceae bacterium]|jgi:hypothetical protein|nr:hypothetical protein [Ilumatobacteraceae bacterium]